MSKTSPELFLLGMIFGLGIKVGMATYDYIESGKAKTHLKLLSDYCSKAKVSFVKVS